jgi:serine-type D-Ala-D-Ala carboxypeptidase (penicillin-binding protein 5/6)
MSKRPFVCFVILFLVVGLSLSFPTSGIGVEPGAVKKKVTAKPERGKAKPERPASEKGASADKSQGKGAASESSPGEVNAKAAILMEVSTGTILYEQNADELIEPASFTKILSLYLIFEALQRGNIQMKDEVYISDLAWRTKGSKMFVGVGTRVPLEELLKGIAVVSGNDGCVAAAEHLSGSVEAFVDNMNRKAKQLGMDRSRFLNPHGLPAEGQITTARDMATLGAAYIRQFPQALGFHSMKEYTYNNITQHNRNHLLNKDPTVDGLKTGFVAAAGYHLAGTAQREGMRLLAVVMGAATPRIREREAMKLLNFGFRYYTMVHPFPEGQPVTTIQIWKGEKDEIGLYPTEMAAFIIPRAQKNQLRWEVRTTKDVVAPIKINEALGEVVFYVSDQPKRTVALVSQEDVNQAGWFKRTWQTLLQIHKLDWRWFAGITGGIALVLIVVFLLANRRQGFRRSR